MWKGIFSIKKATFPCFFFFCYIFIKEFNMSGFYFILYFLFITLYYFTCVHRLDDIIGSCWDKVCFGNNLRQSSFLLLEEKLLKEPIKCVSFFLIYDFVLYLKAFFLCYTVEWKWPGILLFSKQVLDAACSKVNAYLGTLKMNVYTVTMCTLLMNLTCTDLNIYADKQALLAWKRNKRKQSTPKNKYK